MHKLECRICMVYILTNEDLQEYDADMGETCRPIEVYHVGIGFSLVII